MDLRIGIPGPRRRTGSAAFRDGDETDMVAARPLRGFRARLGRAAVAAAVAGVLASGPGLTQDLRFFRIGTGATNGTYFSIGGLIANAISNPPGSRACGKGGSCGVPGLIAVAQSTQGSVENVRAIAAGQLDSALVQADVVYWAYHGTGLFRDRGPSPGLRAIANLFPATVHIVVRADSGIYDIAGLAGRRVSLGERGSGTLIIARTILAAHGISEDDLEPAYLKPGPASTQLRERALDAVFVVGGVPVSAILDLAGQAPIRLLPITGTTAEELKTFYPFFTEAVIEAGRYPNAGFTTSLGISTQLIVSAGAEDDFVHTLTGALWHERSRALFDNGHPEGRNIVLERALRHIAIPLHPGAARYYEEIGLRRY